MKTRYELSMYGGRRKYICISSYSPDELLERWKNNEKSLQIHVCEDGERIETARGNIDYIKIIK